MMNRTIIYKDVQVPPEELAKQVDLPPGAETLARLLKNPIVAALASVVLTVMTGTPVSPGQIMMSATLGKKAVDEKKALEERKKQQEEAELEEKINRLSL